MLRTVGADPSALKLAGVPSVFVNTLPPLKVSRVCFQIAYFLLRSAFLLCFYLKLEVYIPLRMRAHAYTHTHTHTTHTHARVVGGAKAGEKQASYSTGSLIQDSIQGSRDRDLSPSQVLSQLSHPGIREVCNPYQNHNPIKYSQYSSNVPSLLQLPLRYKIFGVLWTNILVLNAY